MNLDKDHITLYLALWGAIGPLAGIVAGHFLTRSSQHTQWLRDNRKQEYRELLSGLTNDFLHIVKLGTEVAESTEGITLESFRVLNDRILIAQEIKKAEIRRKWLVIYNLCSFRVHQATEAMSQFSALTDELAKMAIADPPKG